MRTLLALAALASFQFANGAPPAVLVADNPSGSFTGTWPASTSVSGYLGRNYQHHAAGTGSDIFTWTLKVPSAGTYKVYARWTQHANRATDATYTVTHAGGSTAVSVNQQAGGGAWNLLGTFAFAPGTAPKVTLTDRANGYVVADAIRLVPESVQAKKKVPAEKKLYFVHTDHLNTPRVITNAAQQVVWRWDNQEPFGNTVPDENPSGLGAFDFPVRMEGKTYFDKETNLLYNTNRYRDPSIGRFPQADPLGLNGGDLSLYVLTKNNPLSFTDPDGLAAQMCCRVLNQFILGTVGRQRHCYFNVDGTTYGLYPEGNVGVPRINDPRDRGGICKDCTQLPCSDVNSCIRDQHDFYPIGDYSAALGPNSNTYAGTIANACCQGGVPSGLGMAPSIGDTPPAHNPNKGKK